MVGVSGVDFNSATHVERLGAKPMAVVSPDLQGRVLQICFCFANVIYLRFKTSFILL